jgi:hypothetical protein
MLARSVRENCILERPVGGLLETQAPEGQLRGKETFRASPEGRLTFSRNAPYFNQAN